MACILIYHMYPYFLTFAFALRKDRVENDGMVWYGMVWGLECMYEVWMGLGLVWNLGACLLFFTFYFLFFLIFFLAIFR